MKRAIPAAGEERVGRTGKFNRGHGLRNRAQTAERMDKKGGIDIVEKRNDGRITFIGGR